MTEAVTPHRPADPPAVGRDAHDTMPGKDAWKGPTYYGRAQLKEAPFNNWVVGGYIFLAGVSGAATILSALADVTQVRSAERITRAGRYLGMLAPTVGSVLLIYDLHTPKRFYNMLRIAKRRSPMSIGTWILMSFSAFAGISGVAQFVFDRMPRLRWLQTAARVAQVPAAITGAGLSTYTASLLSATSTPLWAAAPKELSVRFGSSSVAAGASALSLTEPAGPLRRKLDLLTVVALTAELAAAVASHRAYQQKGVAESLDGPWGQVEDWGATKLGVIAPLVLHGASMLLTPREDRKRMVEPPPPALSWLAPLAVLAGSLMLRVSIMSAGDESATRPDISFQFSQPHNLPKQK